MTYYKKCLFALPLLLCTHLALAADSKLSCEQWKIDHFVEHDTQKYSFTDPVPVIRNCTYTGTSFNDAWHAVMTTTPKSIKGRSILQFLHKDIPNKITKKHTLTKPIAKGRSDYYQEEVSWDNANEVTIEIFYLNPKDETGEGLSWVSLKRKTGHIEIVQVDQ